MRSENALMPKASGQQVGVFMRFTLRPGKLLQLSLPMAYS
jgi:hypothetical protein